MVRSTWTCVGYVMFTSKEFNRTYTGIIRLNKLCVCVCVCVCVFVNVYVVRPVSYHSMFMYQPHMISHTIRPQYTAVQRYLREHNQITETQNKQQMQLLGNRKVLHSSLFAETRYMYMQLRSAPPPPPPQYRVLSASIEWPVSMSSHITSCTKNGPWPVKKP